MCKNTTNGIMKRFTFKTRKGPNIFVCNLNNFRRLCNFLHDLLSTIEPRQPGHREAVRA